MTPIIAVLIALAQTGSVRIVCPPEVFVRQDAFNVTEGWVAHNVGRRTRWSSVSIYYGIPADNALQAPEVERTSTYDEVTWRFGQSKADLWMACTYSGTSVELTKNIGRPTSCTFRLRRDTLKDRQTFECEYDGKR